MSWFIDPPQGRAPDSRARWEPVVIPRAAIDAEVVRLSNLPAPGNGRRESLIVHPNATAPGNGLAPGIRVTLAVLLPGERTTPVRHNATEVGFCIAGGSSVSIGGRTIGFGRFDVWNHPAWTTYSFYNETDEPNVRLMYSNAGVLDQLDVHLVEHAPIEGAAPGSSDLGERDPATVSPFGLVEFTDDGAALMPYELLINPPTVESRALHFPWTEVKANLDELTALGEKYRGRRLYLLYNPLTGRTNGTTPSFFATMTVRPPAIVDRPHRHVSAAINYYFHGRGHSIVGGRRYDWEAGDLMFSAPGWAVHHHASGPDDHVYELTIQDQPFHLALESLLWQEELKRPARLLGSQPGFVTNWVDR